MIRTFFDRARLARAQLLGPVLLLTIALGGLSGCDDDTVCVVDRPPAVPTGVYTITGDGQVEVRWNPVWEEDVEGYGVYRSDSSQGEYHRIATVLGRESNSFVDVAVTNGRTYYYAVDAFDFAGHESELSYEDAFDTPRPAGANVTVFARQDSLSSSGIDFSAYDSATDFVIGFDADSTDIYFQRIGSVLFAKGTIIDGYANDIQDFGYTTNMDEISYAPSDTTGWSSAPDGVELIEKHTYVVWTWDSHFAKFRVVAIVESSPDVPSYAVIDWAYQIDPNNPELSPLYKGGRTAQESGGSET